MTTGTPTNRNPTMNSSSSHDSSKRARNAAPTISIEDSTLNDSAVFSAAVETISPSAVLKKSSLSKMSSQLPNISPVIKTELLCFLKLYPEAYYKLVKSEKLRTSTTVVTSARVKYELNFNSNIQNEEGPSLLTDEKNAFVDIVQQTLNSFATRAYEFNRADHKLSLIKSFCRLLHNAARGVIAILQAEHYDAHQAALDYLTLHVNNALVILKCGTRELLSAYQEDHALALLPFP